MVKKMGGGALFFSLSFLLLAETEADKKYIVKITDKINFVDTTDSGHKVRIERVQSVDNVLRDDYTKTSRKCPPFCIQPTEVDKKIENIAELEVLKFIQTKVASNKGIVVDTRLHSWFELETIPSAVNIPYTHVNKKVLKILGMKQRSDGSWDGSKVKDLVIFDNGMWCEQAKRFVANMVKNHYPKDKIHYYRAGLQGWKILGLTTIVHKEIAVK